MSAATELAVRMEPMRFTTTIRYWNPEKASGLAVADVPPDGVGRD